MSVSSHEVWALGHVIMLASSLRIAIAYTIGVFGKPISTIWYKSAYMGALLSYSIVVYKSVGFPQMNSLLPYLQRALMDDNVQYALLAGYWSISKPVYFSLIPFATFSLFHVLTFVRTNVLPKFIPRSAQPTGAGAQGAQQTAAGQETISRRIQVWVKSNYDTAMRFVAYVEIFLLLWTVGRAVTFVGSFLTPLMLFHFIRMRYFASPFTREAVAHIVGVVDARMARSAPAPLNNAWRSAKGLATGWLAGMGQQQQQGQAAGPGAGARQAGARPAAGAAAGRR